MTKQQKTKHTTAEIAEEIRMRNYIQKGSLFSCHRCGRQLRHTQLIGEGPFAEHVNGNIRYITLTLPPEEGKVKSKDYNFYMCQWCTTEFLKFMQEKEKK